MEAAGSPCESEWVGGRYFFFFSSIFRGGGGERGTFLSVKNSLCNVICHVHSLIEL